MIPQSDSKPKAFRSHVLGSALRFGIYILALACLATALFALGSVRRPAEYSPAAFREVLSGRHLEGLRLATVELVGSVLLAFVAANVVAASIAWLAAIKFPRLRRPTMTLGVVVKATPVVVLIPMMSTMGLVSYQWLSKHVGLVGGVMVSFFPTLVEATKGLAAAPREIVWYYRDIVGLPSTTILGMKARYALRHLFPALKVSFVLTVIGCIVGEMVLTPEQTIGELIARATSYSSETLRFLAFVVCAATALVGYALIELLEEVLCWWESPNEET